MTAASSTVSTTSIVSTTPTIKSISDLWHEVIGTQTAPSRHLVIGLGVAALLIVAYRPAWRIARNAITIAHEGGHALVALASGRRLAGVRLHSDTSGVTVSYGKPRGLGMVLTMAAGYITPSLLGLGGAWLLAAGHITGLLWAFILLLLVFLFMIRNAFGALTVLTAGAAIFAVSWFATVQVQAGFAYLIVSFLLVAGVKPVIELHGRQRVRGQAGNSDPDQLARLTGVPALFWTTFFFLVAVASLVAGARWLLHL